MLKQRLITAAILIPITLLFLFYATPIVFLVVTALIILAASWEWASLMQLRHPATKSCYLLFMVLIMLSLMFVPINNIIMLGVSWWILALFLVVAYPRASSAWSKSVVVRGLMGFLVLLPCWVAINMIFKSYNGAQVLLYLLVLIWGADSTAYFVGKKWGKTKLIPKVSPGKSVQGLVGAVIFAFLYSACAGYLGGAPLSMIFAFAAFCVLTVLFSILGDLFESMLKRSADLKDSGSLLPGHGGLLDRIDSLTAAAPVYVYGFSLMMFYLN